MCLRCARAPQAAAAKPCATGCGRRRGAHGSHIDEVRRLEEAQHLLVLARWPRLLGCDAHLRMVRQRGVLTDAVARRRRRYEGHGVSEAMARSGEVGGVGEAQKLRGRHSLQPRAPRTGRWPSCASGVFFTCLRGDDAACSEASPPLVHHSAAPSPWTAGRRCRVKTSGCLTALWAEQLASRTSACTRRLQQGCSERACGRQRTGSELERARGALRAAPDDGGVADIRQRLAG